MSRSFCYRCQRVSSSCLCAKVKNISNHLPVTVLQHPDEQRHKKGTAIIASLCLENYQCWRGEDFSDHEMLNKLLAEKQGQIVLVYPATESVTLSSLLKADCFNNESAINNIEHLLFIDATWRKAKKVWALSTNLQKLRTITLDSQENSNYRIRKAPVDGYLSTIESIYNCLSVMDNDHESSNDKYRPLIDLFEYAVDMQIDNMGQSTYENNYLSKRIDENE